MYAVKIYHCNKVYLLEELIKVFLRPDEYRIAETDENLEKTIKTSESGSDSDSGIEGPDVFLEFNKKNSEDRDEIKREIYDVLSEITGMRPPWGILTGIRPVKLFGELCRKYGDVEKACQHMANVYYVSEEKIALIKDMYQRQYEMIGDASDRSAGIYIGIPFCPTRCVYCSFASNPADSEKIALYLEALKKEIQEIGKLMKEKGVFAETVYIGGGTPTTLSASQLDELLKVIRESFDLSHLLEFTVEAGRPDTIDSEKLKVIYDNGVGRISINPQSMKQKTLDLIGREHTPGEIEKAFLSANEFDFNAVNADVIAGLPEEDTVDFMNTLKKVVELEPENITVHSLTVKRSSRLKGINPEYHYEKGRQVSEMLEKADQYLVNKGYLPYYLYRQKNMSAALENTGYAIRGKEGVYNMRIMDEHQTIIALGAGAISKAYDSKTDKLTRVPNVTNCDEYINRIDEMIDRKYRKIFLEVL